MLIIKDLHKNYKSAKGDSVQALKGINLELDNKGFVVILGKSGSGKSTLLNILGGLDSYDKGQVIINGKETNDFKINEWDSFRNTYVGFVFQEFYIIDEFSVGKNIALALELQGYKKEEINTRVEDILKDVELDGYKNRKTSEISGGQKQRIAIARALVKSPPIILVDEPTGNLDSETGKIILEKLKELSKEKLIIMVTHDEEFARIYGDRIIELKDGQVISDNKATQIDALENDHFELRRTVLPFTKAFQLAISSLMVKRFRLLLMTLLFTFSLIFVGIATTFSFYDIAAVSNLTFKNDGIEYIPLTKYREYCIKEDGEKHCYNKEANVLDKDIKALREQFPSLMFTNTDKRGIYNILKIQESQRNYMDQHPYYDIFHEQDRITIIEEDMFTLRLGQYPSKVGDILISDYLATVIVELDIIDGVNNFEDLIGQKLIANYKDEYNITGIVKTDYERFNYLKQSTNSKDFLEDSPFIQKRDLYYLHYYMAKETYDQRIDSMGILPLIEGQYSYKDNVTDLDIIFYTVFDDTSEKSLIGNSRMPLDLNEIVISTHFIQEAFPYVQLDNEELLSLIGESFNYTIKVYKDNEMKKETINFKIVGIFSFSSTGLIYNNVIVSNEMFEYIDQYYHYPEKIEYNAYSQALVKLDNNDQANINLLRELKSLNYKHETEYSDILYKIEDLILGSRTLFYVIGTIFTLFSSFMIFTFISLSINRKQKTIGTLRSMGARGIDVAKIFVFEGIIIAIIASILAITLYGMIVHLINQYISNHFNTSLVFLNVNQKSVLIIILLSVIIVLLSSFIPVKRITKMKPIDAIKKSTS